MIFAAAGVIEHSSGASPALTLALAAVGGAVSISLARHLKVPGIVLLLGCGVLLGPDVIDIVKPDALGPWLSYLTGFAVAVILFEGGMSLELSRVRREARTIRWLITIGAMITAVGGALAARLIMGWDWWPSILFGTLVIVTGPTVITPLLRRIRLQHSVATVLEAEGVLIDAIGAITAVVALEVAISQETTVLAGIGDGFTRLAIGALIGALGGVVIAGMLRFPRIIPDGLENIFTLSAVVALYQISDAVRPESGIAAVTVAGIVVGNIPTRVQKELREFKEQLTMLLIGVLFVLLAADVRLSEVQALGWQGLATVAALMVFVRPVNIWVCTLGSELNWREKSFLSWMAPRGIVAAAVASLFANTLDAFEIEGGSELRALVFLVISVTVVLQGLSGGAIASMLGLRRPTSNGYAILGANYLGIELGRLLREGGHEVVFIDSNPDHCTVAEQQGFKVVYGNALEERTLQRAEIDSRAAAVAVTGNEEINLLFAKKVQEESRSVFNYVALHAEHGPVTPTMVREQVGHVLFARPRSLELWMLRLERKLANVEAWRAERDFKDTAVWKEMHEADNLVLPMCHKRGAKIAPVEKPTRPRKGDTVYFAIFEERGDQARAWLSEHGWSPVANEPGP